MLDFFLLIIYKLSSSIAFLRAFKRRVNVDSKSGLVLVWGMPNTAIHGIPSTLSVFGPAIQEIIANASGLGIEEDQVFVVCPAAVDGPSGESEEMVVLVKLFGARETVRLRAENKLAQDILRFLKKMFPESERISVFVERINSHQGCYCS